MKTVRAQYYFRKSSRGLLAWDVRRIIRLSKSLPIQTVPLSSIAELEENHWYSHGEDLPTCRSIVEHIKLIAVCDTQYPIVLDRRGRVMDGMHRVCKALLNGEEQIRAVQFETDPEPDYIDCDPLALPYDD